MVVPANHTHCNHTHCNHPTGTQVSVKQLNPEFILKSSKQLLTLCTPYPYCTNVTPIITQMHRQVPVKSSNCAPLVTPSTIFLVVLPAMRWSRKFGKIAKSPANSAHHTMQTGIFTYSSLCMHFIIHLVALLNHL